MSFKEVNPARGYYALEAVEVEKKGTFQVATERDMPQVGKITHVGETGLSLESGRYIEPEYRAGDVVAFPRYTDNKLKVGDKEVYLVKFENVMARLIEGKE